MMKYKNKRFITYGFKIDRSKFKEIRDTPKMEYLQKPYGGLWCSPVNSEFGWKNWCLSENYFPERLNIWTTFELMPSAKILEINSLEDLVRVGRKYGKFLREWDQRCIIQFERIRDDGYNGVFLSEEGNLGCHLPLRAEINIDLNAWDCESMVLFDLDHIKVD